MQESQLVIFSKSDIKKVLQDLDFKIKRKKISERKYREVVVGKDDNPIRCPACEKEIPIKKAGTIAYGSRLLFCDNPLCFATWVAQNKIR